MSAQHQLEIKESPATGFSLRRESVALDRFAALTPITAIAFAAIWLLVNPDAQRTIESLSGLNFVAPLAAFQTVVEEIGVAQIVGISTLTLLSSTAFLFDLSRYLGIHKRTGSIRGLMRCLVIVAFWCGLLTQSAEIAWIGQKVRSRSYTHRLEELAGELRVNWPRNDGEIEGLGPYTSYPYGRPTVLLLLSPYPLEGTDTVISAVERSVNGSLRFQLGGAERGAWLEWHTEGSRPDRHTNGLAESRHVQRLSKLGPHWYLVRYQAVDSPPSIAEQQMSDTTHWPEHRL